MRPDRSIMCAANEEDDSVFCLIECREALQHQEGQDAQPPLGSDQRGGSEEHSAMDKSKMMDRQPVEHR